MAYILQSRWPVFLEMVKVIKSKENMRNFHSQVYRNMAAKCNMLPWMEFCNNGTLGKTKEIQIDIDIGALVMTNVQQY